MTRLSNIHLNIVWTKIAKVKRNPVSSSYEQRDTFDISFELSGINGCSASYPLRSSNALPRNGWIYVIIGTNPLIVIQSFAYRYTSLPPGWAGSFSAQSSPPGGVGPPYLKPVQSSPPGGMWLVFRSYWLALGPEPLPQGCRPEIGTGNLFKKNWLGSWTTPKGVGVTEWFLFDFDSTPAPLVWLKKKKKREWWSIWVRNGGPAGFQTPLAFWRLEEFFFAFFLAFLVFFLGKYVYLQLIDFQRRT
jgi:hypothetical protein